MRGVLVDSNIILDILLDDPQWGDWSESVLEKLSVGAPLYINPIIYAEVSVGFDRIDDMESAMRQGGFQMLEIPKEALFLAGKAFLRYKKRKGIRRSPLPDFFIGAQSTILGLDLITRDDARYRTYFPTVRIICPGT